MRISDFILLNEQEKRMAVLHNGVLLAKRKDFDSVIFLFQLGSYYVETYCNSQNKEIEEYRVFDSNSLLNPYLDAIPIHKLFD